MEIMVCYQTEADLDKVPERIWSDLKDLPSMLPFIPEQINLYDESALELGRRLIASSNGAIRATALKLGEKTSNPEMKNLMALGYENVYQMPISDTFSPKCISQEINDFIESNQKPDLIVSGYESALSNDGQMAYLLAELLNWPCIGGVIDFCREEDGRLKVVSDEDDALLIQKAPVPLVLVVGNSPDIVLKIPSLREKLKYKDFKAQSIEIPETKKTSPLIEIFKVDKKRECQYFDSSQQATKAIINLSNEVAR